MAQHIGPRTISATGGSIERVGNHVIHSFPPKIVSEGLILHWDPQIKESYPATGTQLYDLSGYNHHGTLNSTNIDFNNDVPHLLNFDGGANGNNEYVATGHTSTLAPEYVSLSIWIVFDSVSISNQLIAKRSSSHASGGGDYWFYLSSNGALLFDTYTSSGQVRQQYDWSTSASGNIPARQTGVWYNLTATFGPDYKRIYINGNLAKQSVGGGPTNTYGNTSDLRIAQNSWDNSYRLDGAIGQVLIYNRPLTQEEVTQNYQSWLPRRDLQTSFTFTPNTLGNESKVEVLCVAGGGAGGQDFAGGGGAGGLVYNSAFPVSGAQTVTIGRGGLRPSGGNQNRSGYNSSFGSITATGGGSGGGSASGDAQNGGSGGGSGNSYAAGTGVAGQGHDGVTTSSGMGGGGGGAGGPGLADGTGGPGLAFSISGKTEYYAGGGGGSTSGSKGVGGIGGGGTTQHGVIRSGSGVPGTGGGGGGFYGSWAGAGTGGHGQVIVRYPAIDYKAEVLIVAGGGGGGFDTGGGGGAGGLIYHSGYQLKAGKKYKVVVGGGGTRASSGSDLGDNGKNSVFNTDVAIGGGGGGSNQNQYGLDGGSGGGGGAYSQVQGTGGEGVAGQGSRGGDAVGGGTGGGGGGAGTAGKNGNASPLKSIGGDGLTYSITGTSTVYAAGGGGGQNVDSIHGLGGSNGVGGDGGLSTRNPTDPDSNTGSGGGGGCNTNQPNGNRRGSNGAAGRIVIAYKGPQRGLGGTIDTTSRPGYTLHIFEAGANSDQTASAGEIYFTA